MFVKPFVLTRRMEEILKTLHFYRYMTAQDIVRLFFAPSSITYVREMLALLSQHKYLYRFQLPHSGSGNTEMIYTLGSRGRDYLVREGMEVDWYFRPYKVNGLSYNQTVHDLLLTRFCVAASSWAAKQPDFRLSQIRLGYELTRLPETPIVPDGWLLFEKLKDGAHAHYFPVLLEVDRGTEHAKKFKFHVSSRLNFVKKGGAYSQIFGQEAVIVAYVTTGQMPHYRERRRETMCAWAGELLKEYGKTNWAHIFRFTAVVLDDLYNSPIFDEPVWFQPNSTVPVPLFAP